MSSGNRDTATQMNQTWVLGILLDCMGQFGSAGKLTEHDESLEDVEDLKNLTRTCQNPKEASDYHLVTPNCALVTRPGTQMPLLAMPHQ